MTTAKVRRYAKTFEAVGFGPVEAEHLRIRADLMLEVERLIAARGLTQVETAKLLHVTQPRISDLMRGKIERFSIDTLVGRGMGTFVSCLPGRLAYYEGEEPGERYVLERARHSVLRYTFGDTLT